MLRHTIPAVTLTTLLFVSGCGLAADFAVPAAAPTCDGPACEADPDSGVSAAATASPATAIAAPTSGLDRTPASPQPAASVAPSAASQVAFDSAAATLGPVVWATEIDPTTSAPRAPVETFGTENRILYATVAVVRVRAGTEFGVEWTYNDTRLESFDDVIVTRDNSENIWIEFHLSLARQGVWPSGTYEIAISVDGQPAVSGQVEVVEPGG